MDLSSEDFQSDLLDLASLSTLQKADEEIAVMLSYLTNGELPSDEKKAQRIVFESRQFSVVDGVTPEGRSTVP